MSSRLVHLIISPPKLLSMARVVLHHHLLLLLNSSVLFWHSNQYLWSSASRQKSQAISCNLEVTVSSIYPCGRFFTWMVWLSSPGLNWKMPSPQKGFPLHILCNYYHNPAMIYFLSDKSGFFLPKNYYSHRIICHFKECFPQWNISS